MDLYFGLMESPVAWLHILNNTEGIEGDEPERRLTFSEENPFGDPGVDYSAGFTVTSIPLFGCLKSAQVNASYEFTQGH